MHKMYQIRKEAYKKCEIEIIENDKYFWINRINLEIESDYKNWAVIFDKCDPEKQMYGQELIPNTQFQRCRVFVGNDLAERKIKSCRVSSKKILEFKEKLGLDPNKYGFEKPDIISALQVAFEGEIMHTQYCVQNKRLDLYFSKRKLGIEIDEYVHIDRDFEYEQSRQLMTEKNFLVKLLELVQMLQILTFTD